MVLLIVQNGPLPAPRKSVIGNAAHYKFSKSLNKYNRYELWESTQKIEQALLSVPIRQSSGASFEIKISALPDHDSMRQTVTIYRISLDLPKTVSLEGISVSWLEIDNLLAMSFDLSLTMTTGGLRSQIIITIRYKSFSTMRTDIWLRSHRCQPDSMSERQRSIPPNHVQTNN
jgi:hypothetical protein